jgi:hypothetical protein
MSRAKGDTLHAARLLQGKLVRLHQRRQRALDQAQSDYRIGLLMLVSGTDTGTIDVVQRALDNDRTAPELAADLRHATAKRPEIIDADFPEVEIDGDDLPPPLPAPARMIVGGVDLGAAPGLAVLRISARGADGNETWGLADLPAPDAYRYPEPGEPARQLADGRIVAATVADEAPAET